MKWTGLSSTGLAVLGGGAILLASGGVASTQDVTAPPSPPVLERPNINPYDRDIQLTAPLQFNQRILGEMPIMLTRDDRLIIYSEGFGTLISPLLTPEAQAEILATLSLRDSFEPEVLKGLGIELEYDPNQLAILVLRVDPTRRAVQSLFDTNTPEAAGRPPEPFSAYLNTNLAFSHTTASDDLLAPSVFLNGAIRYGRIVFEADVQGREAFGGDGEYEVERQFARFVYDEPELFRRWYLGDLDPETRGRQGFAEMGGVGVIRQRQRFDSFRNNILAGGRQIVLQEASTIRVLRNGVFQREFLLDPGQYDLSNLPLDTGSNNVELEILGQSGARQQVSYQAYLDTIDLEPGDYEYGAFLGVTSVGSFGAPDYSDGSLAFTGYWRKAFENRPALGLGLQLSEDVQNAMAQTQFLLPNGGRLRVDGSASLGFDEPGYAFTTSYDHFIDRGGRIDNWTVAIDYTSENYTTLGSFEARNPTAWAISAAYSRRFSERLYGSASASYRVSRSAMTGDAYSVSATSNYRLSPEWTFQAGVEAADYGRSTFGRDRQGVGLSFAIIWQPRYDIRADARYASVRNSGGVRYQKSQDNRVGSIGYSVAANYDDGPGSVSGQVNYIGNRFDASVSHATFGEDFGRLGDEQVTTLRVGSSVAFAGGRMGVGRNIFDSFALVQPHSSLRNRQVIVGDNLEGGAYVARSGLLGSAVAGNLTSYVNQVVRYDVIDPPPGYNVGTGADSVRPAYRSGYSITVGRADFVSATGRLVGSDRAPLPLATGRIRAADATDAKSELFFTNSVGRFAIQNLEPGRTYIVEVISGQTATFEFTVPEDNEGLYDLSVVSLPFTAPREGLH